jgi:hypothetical protein
MKKLVVILLFVLSTVLSAVAGDPIKCKGTTKKGEPCKSTIVSKKTGYCNAHDPNKPHCKAKNSKGEPCGVAPEKNAEYCRHHSK